MADLEKSSNLFSFISYADDTTLYLDFHKENVNEDLVNSEITKVVTWLKVNKLTVNPKKTKLMTFGYRKSINDPMLFLDNELIWPVSEFNFLGLTIDR